MSQKQCEIMLFILFISSPFPFYIKVIMPRLSGQPDVQFQNLMKGIAVTGWMRHDKINQCKTILDVVRPQFRTGVLKNFCPVGKICKSPTI